MARDPLDTLSSIRSTLRYIIDNCERWTAELLEEMPEAAKALNGFVVVPQGVIKHLASILANNPRPGH